MKKLTAILSSLVFLSLGITACSKDGSKKQPNFRNRHQGKVTQQTPQQKPGEVNPDGTRKTEDDSTRPTTTVPPVTLTTDTPCDLQVDKTTTLTLNACQAVLVAMIDGEATALSDNGSYFDQGEEKTMTKEVLDNGDIEAKHSEKQQIVRRNLKVIQIMKDGDTVDIPAELQFQAEAIETDELQTDLREKVKSIKIQNGDHLLVVTNIDELIGVDNAIRKEILDNNVGAQSTLTFADASKLDEAIEAEKAILNSYVAQLSLAVAGFEVDDYKTGEDDVTVTVNGEELLHDEVQITENTSTNRITIQILDVSNFTGPEYEILVEIEKE